MQAFQAYLSSFESLNARDLGVIPDDVETHTTFSASLDLRSPLVYDRDGAIQTRCAPGRITSLSDRAGIIRFVQEGMPKNGDLLRELGKL